MAIQYKTGYDAMPELVKRQYANNKSIWEAQTDKNSDVAVNAKNKNDEFRKMYDIPYDDMDYRTFNNTVINGALLNNSNKYMKKLDNTYKSPYQQQLENDMAAVRNFKYNPADDPLYKVYADMYARQGAAAQNKTYSDLTAMSGGRNNSWASAATAQVGQAYAQKTAEMIPQLAEAAYNKLLQKYNLSRDMENTAYSRYNDQWNRDKLMSDSLYDRYNTERDFTYKTEEHNAYMQQHEKNMRDSDLAYDINKFNFDLDKMYTPQDRAAALTAQILQNTGIELSNEAAKIALKYAEEGYSLDNIIKKLQADGLMIDNSNRQPYSKPQIENIYGGNNPEIDAFWKKQY